MNSVFSQDDIYNFTGSRNVSKQKAWCKFRGIRYDYQQNGENIYFTQRDYDQGRNPQRVSNIKMNRIA